MENLINVFEKMSPNRRKTGDVCAVIMSVKTRVREIKRQNEMKGDPEL